MAKKKRGRRPGTNKSAALRDYLEKNPAAKPAEAVEALRQLGIEIKPSFVSTMKWEMQKNEAKGERAPQAVAATDGAAVDLASVLFAPGDGRASNKSEAIRRYLQQHPGARTKDVVEALNAGGYSVTSTHVSNVKASLAKRNRGSSPAPAGARRGRPPRGIHAGDAGHAVRDGHTGLTLDKLMLAKKLTSMLGGIPAARQAIDLLESFQA